jgi:nitrite reductase/ring-hydroxylating ferredoxin subunit
MSSFVDVSKVDKIHVGKMKSFAIEGKHILVVNHDRGTSW